MSATSIVMPNDLSDLCRVCLQLPEDSQYLDLTTIYDEDDNLTYSECFTICTQIYLSAGQGVPHHLCKSCGLELQMSYDFRKKVEESNRVLQQYENQMQEDAINQEELMINPQTQIQQQNKKPEQQQLDKTINVLKSEFDGDHHSQSQESLSQQDYFSNLAVEEEEENAVDVLSKVSSVKNSQDISVNMVRLDSLEECVEIEEHLELEDFQNLETLEEEFKRTQHKVIKQELVEEYEDRIIPNKSIECELNSNTSITVKTEKQPLEEYETSLITELWDNDLPTSSKHLPTNTNKDHDEILTQPFAIKKELFDDETMNNKETFSENKVIIVNELVNDCETIIPSIKQRIRRLPLPNGPPFTCDICGHSSATKNSLCQHRLRKHRKKEHVAKPAAIKGPPFICDNCGHNLPTKNALIQHRLRKHRLVKANETVHVGDQTIKETNQPVRKGQTFKCTLCGHNLPTKNALCQHRLRKHRQRDKYHKLNETIKPIKEITQKNVQLTTDNICDEIKIETEILSDHITVTSVLQTPTDLLHKETSKISDVPKRPRFICDICGHSLPTKNSLCKHRIRKHRKGEQNSLKAEDEDVNDGIVKSSANNDLYRHCNQKHLRNVLEKHQQNKLEKSDENIHILPKHGKDEVETDSQNLTTIALIKPGERLPLPKGPPYKCCLCDYSSATKDAFAQHRYRIHRRKPNEKCPNPVIASGKVRPFVCDICGYKLPTKCALTQHRHRKHRYNNNAFPFKCELCYKGFKKLTYLKIHLETKHENLKPSIS